MKHKKLQRIAIFLLVVFIQQIIFPTVALALTSGPSQPEVQSFEPFSTSEMVNLSSGDMTYNIPLIDVDGYPVNISYSSGITMDQEASWVGLGWNINPGVINRNMRGIPDDFNGDVVTKESHIKANNTYGVTFPVSGELLGLELASLGLSLGISFNNYKGVGLDMSFSVALDGGKNNKGPLNASMGVSLGSESGLGVNPQLSFSKNIKTEEDKAIGVGGKLGMSYSSRGGLSALSFSGSAGPTALDKSKATKDGKTPEQASEAKNDVQVDADGNGGAASAGPTYTASGPAFNGGSSISLAGQTYTPSISMPMLNLSVSASFTGGFEVFGLHPNIRLNGYYSGQYLMGGSRSLPAYGYINSQNGQNLDEVMLDFNREKDGGYTDNTPSLPLTNFTYDIYSVSGQGIGGMYRAFRGDLGYVFDSEVNSYSMNIPLPGIELGVGVAAGRFGCNLSLNGSNSKSGKWKEDNLAAPALKFRSDKHNGNNLYEAAYFKQAGEKLAETDPDFFEKMGGFDPTRIELLGAYSNLPALSAVRNEVKGTVTPITAENYRKNRARRNEMIAPLSGDASSKIGVSKYIESFGDVAAIGASAAFATQPSKTSIFSPTESIPRNQYPRKGHHISEITSTRSDGTRYIYGVPAYNLFQKDVTFAVSGRTADEVNGLVRYNPGKDNSADNSNGTDNFFERISNPPYAHSYLLTAVLGANYVDLTDDGPTLDDLGGYTKINYSKVSGDGFGWRTPFEENMASHNEGMKSQTIMDEYNDDKGSYIYGKKEVWQMHSIETKNKVAIFYTSYRDDGLGVKGENGGKDVTLNSSKLRKLDKIEVYAREDLTKFGLTGATPVKTVHFEYDYSLCANIPNHVSPSATNGKLTLRKIYFTYGKSQKSMLSPYEFQYGEMKDVNFAINPKYNMKGSDRWGNYKQTKGDVFTNCNLPASLPINSDYPYTDQDKFDNGSCALNGLYKADVYAHAWNLTKIIMPSGGEVKIEYEADDYAYVQDRRAMQMMKVVGGW
ncbi:MAG: hypothetical protein EAY81_04130 [Bacteroidetes bacterium]|nr:MAG: hypothetical protein EAY81_04130 [Bacteroidota bacterium]